MPAALDLTGDTFGRLTVVARAEKDRWCACGLLLAGSTRQILAMCEVHWRTCGTWQLLTYDPRFAPSQAGVSE